MTDQRKRSYDGTRRSAQSGATRDRIIDAAEELFLERGYVKTAVRVIADRAEVHVDTIYALVGRKPDLARVLVERALSGSHEVVPAAERDYVATIRTEPDPRRKVEIYAQATVDMLTRLAPLFLVLREAAHVDESARELWQFFSDRRASNMREFVVDLGGSSSGLRGAYDLRLAADMVWATNSPKLFLLLTGQRGWSPSEYQAWLADTWTRLLLNEIAL